MKYEIEINESPESLKKYLHSIIGDKCSLFESRKIVGKIKKNRIQLEYNNIGNRFPSGIVFFGTITGRLKRSKISGFFIVSPFSLVIIFAAVLILLFFYLKDSEFDPFLLIFGVIFFLIDYYYSYKEKKYIIRFFEDLRKKYANPCFK